jgi:SEC-C motif
MGKLDTITDFVQYLTKKEQFMTSGTAVFATGEEELLAYYLKDINAAGDHDFIIPPDINGVLIEEGLWDELIQSREFKAQKEADRISYLWDGLIEQFNTHILGGTQYYTAPPGIEYSERNIRFLAREPRTRRRFLAQSLVDLIENTPPTMKQVRVIEPSRLGDPYFVFLILPHHEGVPEADYRQVRQELLEAYITCTKALYPQALDIVGIATENDLEAEYRSEDAMYLDARGWTEEQLAEALRFQQETGFLTNITKYTGKEKEYPVEPERSEAPMKGRDRNKPCICGSGKKFKKCCGR